MFRKTRRRIVAAILFVLIVLLAGTIAMIYLASYMEMTSENRSLLEEYVNSYSLAGMIHRHPADPGNMREGPPMLELSTFYSVAITDDGQVLKVDTADVSSLDEDQLTTLAKNHHARATGATINETITRWQLLNIFPPLLIL